MVSGVFGCFWHSLVACWSSVALLPLFVSMGADSCPAVCRFGACGGHVPTLCLRCTLSFVSVAWRSSSVAFLLVPLPPSAFFLIYLFTYLFFRGFVHFTSTGLLASV